jgi:hypothetical protein
LSVEQITNFYLFPINPCRKTDKCKSRCDEKNALIKRRYQKNSRAWKWFIASNIAIFYYQRECLILVGKGIKYKHNNKLISEICTGSIMDAFLLKK